MKTRMHAGQRGSALVVVLLIFALAYALGVEVIYRQHHVQTRTQNLLEWDQRYQYAVAVETIAIQGLVDDLEDDRKNNELLDDCVNEQWAVTLPPTPYGDAVVSATVQDLQARFNINSLVSSANNSYQRDAEAVARFEALLAERLAKPTKAGLLAAQMADWLDSNNLVDAIEGAEDAEYRVARTANQPVVHESEMRALLGFAAEDLPAEPEPFWPYLTALPLGTRLNVNTAPEPVLAAYLHNAGGQAAAQAILEAREQGPFKDVADVLALPVFANLAADVRQSLGTLLSVSSEYFQLSVDVRTESGTTRLISRLQRPQQGLTRVYARMLTPVLGNLEPACSVGS